MPGPITSPGSAPIASAIAKSTILSGCCWFGRRWKEAADNNVSKELMLSPEVFFCSARKSVDVVEPNWLLIKMDAYSSYWIWAWKIKKFECFQEKFRSPGSIVENSFKEISAYVAHFFKLLDSHVRSFDVVGFAQVQMEALFYFKVSCNV